MIRINDDDPLLDEMTEVTPWGGGRVFYDGKPFTGIVFGYYDGTTQIAYEWEHIDGYEEGRKVSYYPNGIKSKNTIQEMAMCIVSQRNGMRMAT